MGRRRPSAREVMVVRCMIGGLGWVKGWFEQMVFLASGDWVLFVGVSGTLLFFVVLRRCCYIVPSPRMPLAVPSLGPSDLTSAKE